MRIRNYHKILITDYLDPQHHLIQLKMFPYIKFKGIVSRDFSGLFWPVPGTVAPTRLILRVDFRPAHAARPVLPVWNERLQQGDETNCRGVPVRPQEVPTAGRWSTLNPTKYLLRGGIFCVKRHVYLKMRIFYKSFASSNR